MAAGASELPLIFLVLGASIVAGHLAHATFKRHGVSDVLFLLVTGLVAGPILGLVDAVAIAPVMAFLAPLGLIVVLFEGGLELDWAHVRRHAGRATWLTLATWTLSTLAVALVAPSVLGLPPHLALLFAVTVSATGMLAVIPLLSQLDVAPRTRVLLTLETSLGDILSAVATVTLASMYVLGATAWHGAGFFAMQVLVGASIGLLAGVAGARLLHRIGHERHAYAVTLAALLIAYAAAERLGGSGFLMALTFGLVLGNAPALVRLGGLERLAPLPTTMRLQQTSLLFILRSVYFVLLGLSVGREVLAAPALATALLLALALMAARVVAVAIVARRDPERFVLTAMMPRGLAAAVLATLPAAMGVPGTEAFAVYAFLVILGADVLTSAGLWWHGRRRDTARDDAT